MQVSVKLHQDALPPEEGKVLVMRKCKSSHLFPETEKALGFKMWGFPKKEKQFNHTSVQKYSVFRQEFMEENVQVMAPQQGWVTELGLVSTEQS